MGKRLEKSLGDKAESGTCKAPANDPSVPASDASPPQAGDNVGPSIEAAKEAPANDLPMVEAPKLDVAEATAPADGEAVNATPSAPVAEHAAPAAEHAASSPPARSSRFALLAATIAVAAALGSFLGSLSAAGIIRLVPAGAADDRAADGRDVVQAVKAQLAELSALKATLDGASRNANAQFAKIADRLDRAERATADPAAKLAHIADTLDRLDKRGAAAPETTGSIAPSPAPAAPAAAAEPKPAARILDSWIVQDVRDGRAMVENSSGSVFVVGAGSILPGLGRVEAVKRQDGEWVVVTARGLITSGR